MTTDRNAKPPNIVFARWPRHVAYSGLPNCRIQHTCFCFTYCVHRIPLSTTVSYDIFVQETTKEVLLGICKVLRIRASTKKDEKPALVARCACDVDTPGFGEADIKSHVTLLKLQGHVRTQCTQEIWSGSFYLTKVILCSMFFYFFGGWPFLLHIDFFERESHQRASSFKQAYSVKFLKRAELPAAKSLHKIIAPSSRIVTDGLHPLHCLVHTATLSLSDFYICLLFFFYLL